MRRCDAGPTIVGEFYNMSGAPLPPGVHDIDFSGFRKVGMGFAWLP